jgi:hypothetical protein
VPLMPGGPLGAGGGGEESAFAPAFARAGSARVIRPLAGADQPDTTRVASEVARFAVAAGA